MKVLKWIVVGVVLASGASAREYHVAKTGNDTNEGSVMVFARARDDNNPDG